MKQNRNKNERRDLGEANKGDRESNGLNEKEKKRREKTE